MALVIWLILSKETISFSHEATLFTIYFNELIIKVLYTITNAKV